MAPQSSPRLPSVSEADTLFLEAATAKLRSTLRLPSTNPTVARWLFSNRASAFHSDAALLPPDAFADALALSIASDVTAFTPAGKNPFSSPFNLFDPQSSTGSTSLHLLLVPAAITDGIVLGYSLAVGNSFNEQFYPFHVPVSFSPRGLMRGRFAFCPKQKHLVNVINDLAPEVIGIIGLDWLEHNRRDRFFFTVPNEPYSFHRLPTRVLALLKNAEYKVAGAVRKQENTANGPATSTHGFGAFLDDDDKLGDDAGGLVDALSDPDPAAWTDSFLAGMGGPTDANMPDQTGDRDDPAQAVGEGARGSLVVPRGEGGVAFANCGAMSGMGSGAMQSPVGGAVMKGGVGSRGGGFNMTSMFHSLLDLERSLEGRFFAPRMSRDVMNPLTGEIMSRTTGEMRASMQLADRKDAQMLRELTAQSYYAITLAPTTDRMLTFPKQAGNSKSARKFERGEEGGGGEMPCGMGAACTVNKRPRLEVEEAMLMPKRVPVCANCRQHLVEEPASVPMDTEAIREAKKEAKRRKNRLSAARSNQRKKEGIEAQKKELVVLKERLAKLKDVEKTLADENSNLRQQCTMQE